MLQEEMHLVWKDHWAWKRWATEKERRLQEGIARQKSQQDEMHVKADNVATAPKVNLPTNGAV